MRIIVCPLHDVEAIAYVRRPTHILSLISPAAEPTGFSDLAPHHLELRFNDISAPRDGLVTPSPTDIRSILDFGRSADILLVHCWAGVSRSTAAAYILACQQAGPEHAPNIASKLRAAAPYATPNPLMVAIADQRLDGSGAMQRAIAGIGRGSDTCWGAAFELAL